jgi:hypothetical protein
VANDKRRSGGGRVTPKRGQQAGRAGPGPGSGRRSPPAGRRRLPASIGPFARPDRNAPLGQVGKRPSSPANLLVLGLAWIVCGVLALVALKASWKFIPGVVMIGIGLLFLRGGFTAIARHERREQEKD